MYKIGDKLECINLRGDMVNVITLGKTYEVIDTDNDMLRGIRVINDRNEEWWVFNECFKHPIQECSNCSSECKQDEPCGLWRA